MYRMNTWFDYITLSLFTKHNASRTSSSAVCSKKLMSTSKTSDITSHEDLSPGELEKINIEVFQPRRFIYTVSFTLLLFKIVVILRNCGSIPFMLDEYLRPAE